MIRPKKQVSKKRIASQASIPAPTGGLNAKDPIADMSENEAVIMDNYFPNPSSVENRNGSVLHASGMTGYVDTIAVYNDGVNQSMFAVVGGEIFDTTSAGAVGTAEVTGLTNSRFQHINFGTAGGYTLMMVNGEDKMQLYDGSAWREDGDTTTVTGFDTADAIHINNFKNRVWLIEKNTMNAWYLPVSSIGGAANNIDLSGIFKLGGYLMAMGNWTIDNAAGIDDYAVFITSEGEVALYKGTDPSSASTWALVGTFRMGRPLGRRCMAKAGADVLVITTDGAFPLSKALLTDRSQLNLAATDKISKLINTDTVAYFNNYGWQPIIFPSGNKLIINVPQIESTVSIQYVMNTQHGAWCRFTGWDAACFEIMNDRLFYGTQGAVIEADIGTSDQGNEITGYIQQAFSFFGKKGLQKIFRMARPIFQSEAFIFPTTRMNVDFDLSRKLPLQTEQVGVGAEWDVATWDEANWVIGDVASKDWISIEGIGISGGLNISTSSSGIKYNWISTDVIFEVGGSL
jgi:hypothetical protein